MLWEFFNRFFIPVALAKVTPKCSVNVKAPWGLIESCEHALTPLSCAAAVLSNYEGSARELGSFRNVSGSLPEKPSSAPSIHLFTPPSIACFVSGPHKRPWLLGPWMTIHVITSRNLCVSEEYWNHRSKRLKIFRNVRPRHFSYSNLIMRTCQSMRQSEMAIQHSAVSYTWRRYGQRR